jgi:hypothetical protein
MLLPPKAAFPEPDESECLGGEEMNRFMSADAAFGDFFRVVSDFTFLVMVLGSTSFVTGVCSLKSRTLICV